MFPVFPFSCTIPAFYAEIIAFYADIRCYLGFYAWYRAWYVGGVRGPYVDRRPLQSRTWCYSGMQFNLLDQSPILGPSPAPIPEGYWGAELCRSSVSRTSQRILRCFHLLTPILSKGVLLFPLPWIDSIERAQLGLLSLAFCPLKEQTVKTFSVGHDSAYHACLSWYFPTCPGVISLIHTCMNPRQRLLSFLCHESTQLREPN